MTLTVCIGASGSGKTTFLNDVYKSHKCTYIRQYHNLRPYIAVSAIPNFDPTKLPYWDIYINEKKEKSIIVGGTIAGQFMAGLSGGQRKLLLFELIFQRTAAQDNLLIVLDEPFAGVTDNFVPFIVERLNGMRKKHNILLVTNDHVETLKKMADNTVTVSTIDRSKVKINRKEGVDRELALLAMSIGDDYKHIANNSDLQFFISVEFSKNGGIPNVAMFAVFAYGLFLLMFWDSKSGSESSVFVAAAFVSWFTINPYFLQLTDWRIYMVEEAEALLHCSKSMNKALKTCLTLFMLVVVGCIQFACQAAVIGTLASVELFFGLLFDLMSLLVAMILFGLYTDLIGAAVNILAGMPMLLMIFFSTTFSPGAGINGLKELRYCFSRFYLYCMLPVDMGMEGCPESNSLLYLILSSLLVPFLFVLCKVGKDMYKKLHNEKKHSSMLESMKTVQFAELQLELFGEKALKNLQHIGSTVSTIELEELTSRVKEMKRSLTGNVTDDISDDDGEGFDYFLSYLNAGSDPKKECQSSSEKSVADENV
jgi:ABC-type lipoprotein export system ATPase subunit